MKRYTASLWVLIPLCLSPLTYAHAYLDPGAGSYAIQIAIGIIFGASYALRSFSGRIFDRFKGRNKKDETEA